MTRRPYGLICPIACACEILEPRWTIQILTELWNGSTRFNDIRKGLGNISSALLSRRLKEMEALGLIERIEDKAKGTVDYFRTKKAINLEPAMNALAEWAQCNIEAEIALSSADASTVMWGVRRKIDLAELPRRRAVIRFHFRDDPPPKYPHYWLVVEPGAELPELCSLDPGRDVDLYVECGVVSLGAIIEGRSSVEREIERGGLFLSGDAGLARSMDRWLRTSVYAAFEGIVPLS
ncbi:helix-turn-helix domain-containing protein [Mesorhizobium sp.]|uniref:winged helix-turn-helix transcriptional regulator n=1 Tax=Mesorhizobium sp. TaxID=1871066 RepID=UPI000FE44362|nr:helix-turn-helix domain-containing protein [Mesorhizobium sp.]RWA70942.1 MAG: transcriptional regulator [Mesorhizobium sp.]RWB92979.1 MAG: transcriptional regulator [Mesorhizobium sp.]RWG81654.1 MAG: transcriptional regulator [Mesorhizobium sp.]RWG83333.1 MAG: transcriptional regulator [Mesorhizobium sp.]RWK08198.1 MAG: transcriptional regulator [Mesorhizobium sp.]